MENIKITSDGITTKIYLEGVEIERVQSYSLTQKAGGIPVLHLNLNANGIVVDSPVKIEVEPLADDTTSK